MKYHIEFKKKIKFITDRPKFLGNVSGNSTLIFFGLRCITWYSFLQVMILSIQKIYFIKINLNIISKILYANQNYNRSVLKLNEFCLSDFAKAEIIYRTFGLVKSNISPDRIKICWTEKFKWNFDKQKWNKPCCYIFWLLQTLFYCTMQFLHLKSCSQDLCPCCCCGWRNTRCFYMHSTFPWSCTAETLLFVQPVSNVFWPVYNHQDRIVCAYMYVIEQWVKAKVAEFSIAWLEFFLLYLPHTFDSLFLTLPIKKYQPSSFSTKRPPQSNLILESKCLLPPETTLQN